MADVMLRSSKYITLQKQLTIVTAIDPSTVTAPEIKIQLENADNTMRKLEEHHDKLVKSCADEAALAIQENTIEPMRKCYTDIKSRLYELQASDASFTSSRSSASIKLPDMPIPVFDGSYAEWSTFQDLFKATIHNNHSLSGSQKLQYLKSGTRGEAASLIKSFTVTDANYKEAWTLLENQYDNKREIVHTHVRKLLNQPSIKSESISALQELLTTTMESIRSLKVLGRPTDKWDDIISVLVIEKFDGETKAEWARTLKGTDPPTFKEVQDFIQNHIRTLHAKGVSKQPSSSFKGNSSFSGRKISTHHSSFQSCQFCKGSHQLFYCAKLREMQPDKRFAAVKGTNVCLNCLKDGHSCKNCPSQSTCRKCDRKHNTFIHHDQQYKTQPNHNSNNHQSIQHSSQQSTKSDQHTNLGIHSTGLGKGGSSVLLKTALADVLDQNNVKNQVRIFLDDGGEGCLIREACMNQLGLIKQRTQVTITGVAGQPVVESRWKTKFRLYSQVNNSYIDVELYSVPKVTGTINQINSSSAISWGHIRGLRLADPFFQEGGEVDILLGADIVPYVLRQGLRKADRNSPVAQDTMFGWTLFGNVSQPQTSKNQSVYTFTINNFKCEISEAIKRFWEIEEVPFTQPLTREEQQCEDHFKSTHSRQSDGRYMVRLPFNDLQHSLGESRDQAYRRLLSLERRFKRQPQFKEAYILFMREYEQLNHMSRVVSQPNQVKSPYYLPHHFVLKADSTTTKQRTVFDGSAKTTSGHSLNDALLVGPTVQPDLYTLLLRFRYNRIALNADVAKMYRQFLVHPDDRDYQRILWREDSSEEIIEYQLNTVTYGTACAPYCATRCLNQLAEDEKARYPAAAEALTRSSYVDDYLGSTSTTSDAIKLVQELIAITATAGMEIRKWCSSDPAVLSSIPAHLREDCSVSEFDDNSNNSIKALGIIWQPSTDEFQFIVKVDFTTTPTKRFVLAEISKTFDPVGWLSPVTINAKIIMQKLWLAGMAWDEEMSGQLQLVWNDYLQDLVQVEKIRIPRCVISSEPSSIELHGFSDSSEMAIASAVYLKTTYKDGSCSVNLLTSRTKVAPLKTVSLPKLELCGAKLLAETVSAVQKTIDYNCSLFCWTDSTITLRWISSHSRRWKTFVANRVSAIQSLVPPECWHHVRSEDNPADLPSRGIRASELINSNLWWHGPSWLKDETYTMIPFQYDEEEVKKEERAKQLSCFHLAKSPTHTSLFEQFSSFSKLCRCAAHLIRFIHYLKQKKIVQKGPLTVTEVHHAKLKLIQWAQQVSFPDDLVHIQKYQSVSSSSKLLQFTPFLDDNNILRVSGRIQQAAIPEESRHPIILPHGHRITELIIVETHIINLHSGFTLTTAILRQQYWIIRGRNEVRKLIRSCITCRKIKATTVQLMGNLPPGRVTASRPFMHAGVDFAGPFHIKVRKGRHVPVDKAYFAIFICLATKAIHLEAVTSLSGEAFVACYERFSSRRGVSAHFYSDRGTNFVAGDRMMKEFLQQEELRLQQQFNNRGTQWNFNPPSAPHQGGLWEAGVKSVKFHFKRVVGQMTLTLEQFQTLLCRIEACLNSRPLCALSAEPDDLEALTPGHFLIGGPLTAIPEPDVNLIKENRLSYWEIVRQKSQHFWKRWSMEYLTSLQQRYKWKMKTQNVAVGDLVVVADDQMPVTRWKLGRIISTHPGADGLVRNATVKTATSDFKRPVTKLSPLISNHDM